MYRRNTDSQLRNLERTYATNHDRALLLQIDQIRHRSGLLPHPDTRIAIATDRIKEYHFQCFEIVRDISVYLDLIFEGSMGVRLLSDEINERQYIPESQLYLATRRLTDTELLDTVSGRPPSPRWLQYLKSNNIEMPLQGKLLQVREIAMMPHMQREGAAERAEIAAGIRDRVDAHCHDWLNELVRLGIFNAGDLLNAIEDEEAVTEVLLRIEEVLGNGDLAREELLLARLGEDPPAGYKEEIGDEYWWRHIQLP